MRISLITLAFMLNSQLLLAAAQIQHWQTEQGSPVYFVENNNLPMVDIVVTFDAGSARDGYQQGIASFTSALLDTGAGEWNADQIAQRFESVGAHFSSSANRDMASVSLRSLTEKKLLDNALETMQVILSQPRFGETDFQREKKRRLAGLKRREESPGSIARLEYNKALYGDHPYAHSPHGVIETVAGFSQAEIRQFYQKYYVARNAMVVIVGKMSRAQAEKTADRLLQGLKPGEKPAALEKVKIAEQPTIKHIEFPSTQTHVLAGMVGLDRKDPDYFDLYVGNHILGGSGLVSQLFKEVREKRGLAYSAYSYFSPLLRKGSFTMGLQTRNDQTKQALDVMKTTLKQFVEKGPTPEQLNAAKKNITGGFALRFDTNSKLTGYVATIGYYQLPLNYLDTFQQKIEQVSLESVHDAFKRRIKPEDLNIITVGGK